MLEPHDRQLLFDALRPPAGSTLDCAIGTTFTLDLPSLLACPLALALRDAEDAEGQPVMDPVALLDALRRVADRMTIFCQSGRISVPPPDKLLLSHLEKSVVEVQAPTPGHVFHPKVWVLRFVSGEDVTYRLLVLSRNLTPDRAWDTILTLEGPVAERQRAIAANHPLADFLEALPGLAVHKPVSAQIEDRVAKVAAEVRRARFEFPAGVDSLHFWPLGIPGHRKWPLGHGTRRRLVISPFVGEGTLRRLAEEADGLVLVSREETLRQLEPKLLKKLEGVYTLDPDAEDRDPDDESGGLVGLHAKVYVGDGGRESSLWVGSANATDGAFNGNVELLVELRSGKAELRTEAIRATLAPMLREFVPERKADADAVGDSLRSAVEAAREALASAELVLDATVLDDGTYDLTLKATGDLELPVAVTVRAWPITLPGGRAVSVGDGTDDLARFEGLAVLSLTSFVAFDVSAATGDRNLSERFVLNLPLLGDDPTRQQQIVRAVLRDPDQVLRLLMLLLADPDDGAAAADLLNGNGGAAAWLVGREPTVFEALMRSLHEDPRRLDRVEALIRDLADSGDVEAILPRSFMTIWDPIWKARQGLGS